VAGVIEFAGVWKEFPGQTAALEDVSFSVDPDEFVFLTGHSGSGKTTMLRLLHFADVPSRGRLSIAGFESPPVRATWRVRRAVGKVFQDFRLLEQRTAVENLTFALEATGVRARRAEARARLLLDEVGLQARAEARVTELSGGERQRVAIARALANDPKVLLADEPTGNLDDRATQAILDLFRRIHERGTTVMMATHDLALVRRSPPSRVLELDRGRLVYDSARDGSRDA
jgi:cell division transport system ATP-binding protein